MMAVWLRGNWLVLINEVVLCHGRLVLTQCKCLFAVISYLANVISVLWEWEVNLKLFQTFCLCHYMISLRGECMPTRLDLSWNSVLVI